MKQYTVVRGDNLSKIALREGLRTWSELYNHPANEAFRRNRPNPNLIFPGDIISIPNPGSAARPQRPLARQTTSPPARQTTIPPAIARQDEADLKRQAFEIARQKLRSNADLKLFLTSSVKSLWSYYSMISFINRLQVSDIDRMRQRGVLALLFGSATLPKQDDPYRMEWKGWTPNVTNSRPPKDHTGTQLSKYTRVHTGEDSKAVIVFIDDLSSIHLLPRTGIRIYGLNSEYSRGAKAVRADLETGNLRKRLHELESGR